MRAMRDILDYAKPVYCTLTALITLVLLWWGIALREPAVKRLWPRAM